jgi:hypothetical protein
MHVLTGCPRVLTVSHGSHRNELIPLVRVRTPKRDVTKFQGCKHLTVYVWPSLARQKAAVASACYPSTGQEPSPVYLRPSPSVCVFVLWLIRADKQGGGGPKLFGEAGDPPCL